MEYTKEKIEEERVRNKLFNFRPVLFSAIFLAIGIYFGFEKYKGVSVWWAMCLCPIMAAASVFFSRGRERLSAVFICVLLLIGSFFAGYFGINAKMDAYMQAQLPIGECYVRGTVTEKREYNTASGFILTDMTNIPFHH